MSSRSVGALEDLTSAHSGLVCGWDTTHITAARPVRKPLISPRQLNPRMAYRLSDRVKIRREAFGCFVQNRDFYTVKAYNTAAHDLLLALREPVEANTLLDGRSDDDLSIIRRWIYEGLVAPVESNDMRPSSAEFFALPDPGDGSISAPLALELEITLRCGRRCSYCAYGSSPKAEIDGDMSTEAWLDIINQAHQSGVFTVEFTGGDPLTRPDWPEIAQATEQAGLMFTVNSDLTTLSRDRIELLAALRCLIAVQTTLDGATPAQQDRFRGRGAFDRTRKGAQKAVQAGIPVHAGMIVSTQNYRSVKSVARACRSMGISALYIGSLYAAGRALRKESYIPSNTQLGVASRAYFKGIETGLIRPVHPSYFDFLEDYKAHAKTFNHLSNHFAMIKPGLYDFRIDPRGICYTSIKLAGTPLFDAGSIDQHGVLGIWSGSPVLRGLREVYRDGSGNRYRAIDASKVGGINGLVAKVGLN